MTFRHYVISAAACLTTSVAAAADIELYGRLNLTVQNSDEAAGEHVELRNNASRVGVRGERELSTGLKAIYQLEFGVNLDGDSGDDVFTHRNQFVGLQGGFGTLKIGRHDTALKRAQGDFDLFDDLEGDIASVFTGEIRLKDYIGYTTPQFGGAFSATVNFFPGEDPASGNDGLADRSSFSLNYLKDQLYLAAAYDRDVEGEGAETTRLVGGQSVGPVRLMVLYQRAEMGGLQEDGLGASIAWKFGRNAAKFEYLTADFWRLDPQADPRDNRLENMVSLGLDHELGKSTKVFAFYSAGDIGGTRESNRYAAMGIQVNF